MQPIRKLFAIFVAMLASMACVVFFLPKSSRYQGEWYGQGSFNGAGMWEVTGDQAVLKHFVFFESMLTLNFTGDESPYAEPGSSHYSNNVPGSERMHVSVEVIPKGIYLDHVRLPTTDAQRVFVKRRDRSLVPIKLTEEQLAGFTPGFVEHQLESTALWKETIFPLVNPKEIERQKEQTGREAEVKAQADLKARGIEIVMAGGEPVVNGKQTGNFYYWVEWHQHPDGTLNLQNAFITARPLMTHTFHRSSFGNSSFSEHRDLRPPGSRRLFLDTFPTRYEIDGKALERGKPYVQIADGSVVVLELTPEEQKLFTPELLETGNKLMASDLFKNKIAPLIGPPIHEPEFESVPDPAKH